MDFTLAPELSDLLERVRAFVEQDAEPAEAEIADPADLLSSWNVEERWRDRARERGLYAAGIAMDLPIARIFQDARAARIYDGASEAHRMVIARDKLATDGGSVRAACGEIA